MSSAKTMKAWAIKINTLNEVPEAFRDAIEASLESDSGFTQMVYAPQNKHTGKPACDTMMVSTPEEIHFFLKEATGVHKVSYMFSELQAVQLGTVLLQSWIRIFGHSDTDYQETTLYFDTVMEDMFVPVVESARLKATGLSPQGDPPKVGVLDRLMDESMKFLNYGKQSLLPGQQVKAMVYQPRAKGEKTTGETHETAPHLTLLTNEELILIQETKQEASATQKYSGIWTYIPLNQMTHTKLEASKQDGWETLTIKIKGQQPFVVLYEAANRQEIEALVTQLPSMN